MTAPNSAHANSESSFERVRDALAEGGFKPGRISGASFTALCPVHGDRHPSLSVTYDAASGKTLLHCFSCHADWRDLAAAMGLQPGDLFDEERTQDSTKRAETAVPRKRLPKRLVKPAAAPSLDLSKAKWQTKATYTYATADGEVVQEVVREEAKLGSERHKRFIQRFVNPETGRWVKRKPEGFTPVLYNAGLIAQTIAANHDVWLVEGEKDADNAVVAGMPATTNAQGAGSFPLDLAAAFAGAQVNVVLDRDAAGFKRGVELTQVLRKAHAANVRLFLPATTDEKTDLSDHLAAGYTAADLIEITPDDARALLFLAEAQRAAERIQECKAEAAAQIERGSDEDAHSWADEAAQRWQRIHAQLELARSLSGITQTGRDLREAFHDTDRAAAEAAADVYQVAGVAVPAELSAALADNVVPFSTDDGDDEEPPFFDGFGPVLQGDDGAPNEGAEYLVRRGDTVEMRVESKGDGEIRRRFKRLMRGWAEIRRVTVDDDGEDSEITRSTHSIEATFHRWARNEDGHVLRDAAGHVIIETEVVIWDEDQIKDGGWTQALPWPGMLESTSRRIREKVWDAMWVARPAPAQRSTVYTATGWRMTDTGPVFITGSKAITKAGTVDSDIELPGKFASHYQSPDPIDDAQQLRDAWLQGVTPLASLPQRVLAPLLGVVWESVFNPVPLVLHFVGGRAAAKTSVARLGMQFFAPEMCYADKTKREILSGANAGSTLIGLVRSLAVPRHLPVLVDDVAPDGDVKRAQKKLSELGRIVYNGTSRTIGARRGGVTSDKPIRSTVITTGEMSITGSSLTRLLSIPLDPGMIGDPRHLFPKLEASDSRQARGVLGSSLIRWIAAHHEALHNEEEAAEALLTHWNDRVDDLPHDEGLKGRLVEAATAADHGVRLMLRMMVDLNALSAHEANVFYRWAETGIFEAIKLQDSASGDAAEQLIRYVREALNSGAGHLADVDGQVPPSPTAFGWSARGTGPESIWIPGGQRLGWIKEDRVLLLPSVTLGIANAVSARADETFAETSVSVASAMAAHGWIRPDKAGKRAVCHRVDGSLVRVWDLPLSVFTDDEPGTSGSSTGGTPEPAAPTCPDLFPEDGPTAAIPAAAANTELAPAPEPADLTEDAAAAAIEPAEPVTAQTVTTQQEPPAAAQAPTAHTPHKQPARVQQKFAAAAVVLDVDGLHLPDGTVKDLPFPIEHAGDMARLVAHLNLGTLNGRRREDGQILLTTAAGIALGIPLDQLPDDHLERARALAKLTAGIPFLTKALAAGWNVSAEGKHLSATTRIWSDDDRTLRGRLVILDALRADFDPIRSNADATTIARRLQRFADALHTPYAVSAATTGIDLMLHLRPWEQRQALFAPSDPVPPALITTLESDVDWTRKPTEEELQHTWVHAYDRGGSYLAGVGSCEMGIGQPTYYPEGTAPAFDAKIPGYWRILMPAKAEWLSPNPFDPHARDTDITGQPTWVTTPTLEVAANLGYDIEPLEAYLWHEHTRLLDTWYRRVRDARTELDTPNPDDQAARDVLKQMYVQGLGLMASKDYYAGRPGYSPERYHLIQARARANIIRRIQQIGEDTGRWPVAVMRDTILYTSDESDPIAAWPGKPEHLGRGLGQYKSEGSALLSEHQQWLTGARYRGKRDLETLI